MKFFLVTGDISSFMALLLSFLMSMLFISVQENHEPIRQDIKETILSPRVLKHWIIQ